MDNSILLPEQMVEDSFLFKHPGNSAFDCTVEENLNLSRQNKEFPTCSSNSSLLEFELDEIILEIMEDIIDTVERELSSPKKTPEPEIVPQEEGIFRMPELPSNTVSHETEPKFAHPTIFSAPHRPDESDFLYDEDDESEYNFTSKRAMNESIMSVDDPNLTCSKKVCAEELTFKDDYSLYYETLNASGQPACTNSSMDLTLMRAFTGPDSQESTNVLSERNTSHVSNKNPDVSWSLSQVFERTCEDKENSIFMENNTPKKLGDSPKVVPPSVDKGTQEDTVSFNFSVLNASLDESLKVNEDSEDKDEAASSVVHSDSKHITQDSWAGLDASGVNTLSSTYLGDQSSTFCISINNKFNALHDVVDEESFDAGLKDKDQDLVFCENPGDSSETVAESFTNVSNKPMESEEQIVLIDNAILFQQERYELLLRIEQLEKKLKEKNGISSNDDSQQSSSDVTWIAEDTLRLKVNELQSELGKIVSEKNTHADLAKELENRLNEMETIHDTLQSENQVLSQQIQELKNKNNSLRSDQDNSSDAVLQLETKIVREMQDFDRIRLELESEIARLRTDLSNAEELKKSQASRLDKLESKIIEGEQVKSELESQVLSLKDELSNATTEIDVLGKIISKSRNDFEVAEDRVTCLNQETESLNSKLASTAAEYENYKLESEASLNKVVEQLQAYQAQIESYEASHEKFVQDKKEFESVTAQLRSEFERLQADLSDANTAKDEHEQTCIHLKTELENQKNQFEHLQNDLHSQVADLVAQLSNAKTSKDEHERACIQLKAELENQKNQFEHLQNGLHSQVEDLSAQLSNAKTAEDEHERACIQLKAELENQKNEFEHLQKDLHSQVADLAAQLLDARTAKDAHEQTCIQVKAELENQKNQFELLQNDLHSQIADLTTKLSNATTEIGVLGEVISKTRNDLEVAEDRVTCLNRETESLNSKLASTTAEYKNYKLESEASLNKVVEQLQAYQTQIESYEASHAKFVQDIKEFESVTAKLNCEIERLQADLSDANTAKDEHERACIQLKTELENQNNEFKNLQNDLHSQIANLETDLSNANAAKKAQEQAVLQLEAEFEEKLSTFQDSKTDLELQIESLSTELSNSQSQVCQLNKLISELREELKRALDKENASTRELNQMRDHLMDKYREYQIEVGLLTTGLSNVRAKKELREKDVLRLEGELIMQKRRFENAETELTNQICVMTAELAKVAEAKYNKEKILHQLEVKFAKESSDFQNSKAELESRIESLSKELSVANSEISRLTATNSEGRNQLLSEINQLKADLSTAIAEQENLSKQKLDLESELGVLSSKLKEQEQVIQYQSIEVENLLRLNSELDKLKDIDLESLLRDRNCLKSFHEKFQENSVIVRKLSSEITSLIDKIRNNAEFASKLNPKTVGKMLSIMNDKLNKLSYPELRETD